MNKIIEEFYNQYRLVLLKRLYYRAGSPENAEDVLQESFCRALKYKDSFNPDTQSLGAWFNTIMNNALNDHKKAEASGGMYVPYTDETEVYEFSQTNEDSAKRIQGEIKSREGDTKDVLHLYFNKEYKINEIRHILNIPYRSAQTIINRFRVDVIDKYGDDL